MNDISGNLKFWGVGALTLAVWIIKLFSIIAFALLIISIVCIFDRKNSPIFWATFIGSSIAIANALLLYATLRSQNESIVNTKEAHRQECFETTFFNLLELQRRLVDEMAISYKYVNKSGNISEKEALRKHIFSFANSELQYITMALKSNISAKYNEDLTTQEVLDIETEYNTHYPIELEKHRHKRIEGLRNKLRIKLCNSIYDIGNEDRDSYLHDERIAFLLFNKKWSMYFERYATNLYFLLQYVNDEYSSKRKELQKYIFIVQSQMSRDELSFIDVHAKSFPTFRKMLEQTHFTDIITLNKNYHEKVSNFCSNGIE